MSEQPPYSGQPPGDDPPPPPPPPPPPSTPPYQQAYPPPGYGSQGYPQPGYPQAGYPQAAYPQAAYPQPGYPQGWTGQAYPAPAYAHWGLRLGAYLLDTLLLLPFYVVAIVGETMLDLDAYDNGYGNSFGSREALGLILMIIGYLAVTGFAIWNQILRQGRTGQSLGKKWVNIAVVKEGTWVPLGGWLTFGRALLHILDALPCYLGYLWPLWDEKKQTFADKLVKSVVLRTDTPTAHTAQQQAQIY